MRPFITGSIELAMPRMRLAAASGSARTIRGIFRHLYLELRNRRELCGARSGVRRFRPRRLRKQFDSLLGFLKTPAQIFPLEICQACLQQFAISLNILVVGSQQSKGFFQSRYSNKTVLMLENLAGLDRCVKRKLNH